MGTRSKGPNRASVMYRYKEHPRGESKAARRIRRSRRGYRHALGRLWAAKRLAKPKKRGLFRVKGHKFALADGE